MLGTYHPDYGLRRLFSVIEQVSHHPADATTKVTQKGIEPSRSRQIPFPFTRHLSTDYILKYARKLWDEATQPMHKGNMKLNNVNASFVVL